MNYLITDRQDLYLETAKPHTKDRKHSRERLGRVTSKQPTARIKGTDKIDIFNHLYNDQCFPITKIHLLAISS